MVKLNPTTPVHTLNLLELVDTAGAPAYVVAQANACVVAGRGPAGAGDGGDPAAADMYSRR
jgi:hypothetical protein